MSSSPDQPAPASNMWQKPSKWPGYKNKVLNTSYFVRMICYRALMSTGILSAMIFTLKVRVFSTVSLYCINIEHTGKYVYISPATSFLKGRVKGHWYRGKEVTESQLHITISRCIPGDLRKVPVCGPCHQQEVAPQ